MNYQIYVLDYRFQILERHDFRGRDDLSALDEGNSFSRTHPVEIWQQDRLVARIGVDGEGAPAESFLTHPERQRAQAA
jgi:hypothetical protein